jgi:hypothetical protein
MSSVGMRCDLEHAAKLALDSSLDAR